MELTVKEIKDTLNNARIIEFNSLCVAFKQLLKENGLPLSIDINRLTLVYKTTLFEKLLSVDKGLKMKFELLRTDTSKVKMIQDEIDLDGYDIIDEVTEKIDQLKEVYSSLTIKNRFNNTIERSLPLSVLLTTYDLNLIPVIENWEMDWSGKEHVKDYFEKLFPEINKLRDIYSEYTGASCSASGILQFIASFGNVVDNIIELDEHNIKALADKMEERGQINKFNK